MFGGVLDLEDLLVPEGFEDAGPLVHGADPGCVDAVDAEAALFDGGDEVGFTEDAEGFGDGGLVGAEVLDDLGDGSVALGEVFEDGSSAWLGDGEEGLAVGVVVHGLNI